ncbi:MAG: CpaF family protein, partial [Candidatus Eremiobacteraeota bacterium]|nr:CpaF family protein [Candidatus Eremiobacteraeota bacterium]
MGAFAKKLASAPAEPRLSALRPASSLSADGSGVSATSSGGTEPAVRPVRETSEKRERLKAEIREQVTKRIDIVAASRAHTDGEKIAELRAQIGDVTSQLLSERADVASLEDRSELQKELIDELLGLGPLEDLMRDEAVSEIMVNGPNTIYVERKGKLTLSDRRFKDERHLRTIIERIIAPISRRIDEASPMVDARLPDGSRVNAIIEPLALDGSTLTIRRFGSTRLGMDDLVRFGSIAPEATGLLKAMVEARLNVIVSGGTGSGKTTFLNILTNYIPEGERIVTIEDAAELKLNQEHVVRLESRPSNVEGRGAVTIRDLVKNSLRMRPDRIVVGECRSGEALDMLQAMNTGHDGSLTTLHANTPRDAIARLE